MPAAAVGAVARRLLGENGRLPDAVVTDVSGVKTSIVEEADHPRFIGGHPMAGSEQTGLRAGTPVVVGGADTQLALLGLGIVEAGRYTVVGGTFWQHTLVLDQPLVDPGGRLRTLCHSVAGRWMIEGIGFFCGLVMRWFRDAFCDAERSRAEAEGRDVYAILEEGAAGVPPGSGGLFPCGIKPSLLCDLIRDTISRRPHRAVIQLTEYHRRQSWVWHRSIIALER